MSQTTVADTAQGHRHDTRVDGTPAGVAAISATAATSPQYRRTS